MLGISINPVLRGQGLCVTVLRLVLDQAEVRQFDAIYGQIEPDNFASLRCVKKAGFSRVNDLPDADGMLEFVFTRQSE